MQGKKRIIFQNGFYSENDWYICGYGKSPTEAEADLANQIIELSKKSFSGDLLYTREFLNSFKRKTQSYEDYYE